MSDAAERVYRSLLVVRCQAGDRAAFEELIGLHQPRLRYFVAKMIGDEHAADDLVQEVWLEAYRGLARLAAPNAFTTWLYQIARHRVLRELRKRRHGFRPLQEVELADESSEDDFSAEDAERIHLAVEQLPPEHREVLLLRYFEGMSYEDMARVTGCPLGTVRSRLHYAKQELRRIMERSLTL